MKLTLLLIIINVLVFFYSLNAPENFFVSYGFSVSNFLSGKYYVLITSMFLHAGVFHLANNMIALFFLGSSIESKVKWWQYLLVYFLAGILGCLSMFIPIFGYSSTDIAVGASAAISGLIGLGAFVSPGKLTFFPFIIPVPFLVAGAIYFLSTASLLFVQSNMAYPAHFAGLLGGAVFGLIWGENRLKRMILFILICLLILALLYILRMII